MRIWLYLLNSMNKPHGSYIAIDTAIAFDYNYIPLLHRQNDLIAVTKDGGIKRRCSLGLSRLSSRKRSIEVFAPN